jgi:hypothetical protein
MAYERSHPRWLRGLAVLLLVSALATIALIAGGVFDPKPVGRLSWSQALEPQIIPGGWRQLTWLAQPLAKEPYSLRLTAAYQSGDMDMGYGLVIGHDAHYLGVAVSPLGYVTIWREDTVHKGSDENNSSPSPPPSSFFLLPSSFFLLPSPFLLLPSSLLPWQPWPHVRLASEPNEIWLDVVDGRLTARINREWLWSGEVGPLEGQIGLWAESFGAAAVIDYQAIQLFTAETESVIRQYPHTITLAGLE